MKQLIILLSIALSIALAGCAPDSVSPSASSEGQAEAVVPADLPDTVDVETVAVLKDRDDVLLLDVREQSEYDESHIPGVTLIPMGEVQNRIREIPTDKTVIVTCRSGNRSGQVTEFLRQQGLTNVHNMQGGILAWQQAGLPVEQ